MPKNDRKKAVAVPEQIKERYGEPDYITSDFTEKWKACVYENYCKMAADSAFLVVGFHPETQKTLFLALVIETEYYGETTDVKNFLQKEYDLMTVQEEYKTGRMIFYDKTKNTFFGLTHQRNVMVAVVVVPPELFDFEESSLASHIFKYSSDAFTAVKNFKGYEW